MVIIKRLLISSIIMWSASTQHERNLNTPRPQRTTVCNTTARLSYSTHTVAS